MIKLVADNNFKMVIGGAVPTLHTGETTRDKERKEKRKLKVKENH